MTENLKKINSNRFINIHNDNPQINNNNQNNINVYSIIDFNNKIIIIKLIRNNIFLNNALCPILSKKNNIRIGFNI